MEHNTLLLFAVASLSINLIPGPDVIYIVSNTMSGRVQNGIKAALGLGAGYFIHTLAACIGLSAIIMNSALAFSIIKWLGAAYLVYLGLMSIISSLRGNSQLALNESKEVGRNVFIQGVVVCVFNPKVALFFLSFLPQFIDVSSGTASSQLLILGLLFSGLATICNLLYATAGSWLFNRPNSRKYSSSLEGFAGVLLIGLAGKIVLSER